MQRFERSIGPQIVSSPEEVARVYSEFSDYLAERARALGPDYESEADFFNRRRGLVSGVAQSAARRIQAEGRRVSFSLLEEVVGRANSGMTDVLFHNPFPTDDLDRYGSTSAPEVVCRILQEIDEARHWVYRPVLTLTDFHPYTSSKDKEAQLPSEKIELGREVKKRLYDLLDTELLGEVYPQIGDPAIFHNSSLVFSTAVGLVVSENHRFRVYRNGLEDFMNLTIDKPSKKVRLCRTNGNMLK